MPLALAFLGLVIVIGGAALLKEQALRVWPAISGMRQVLPGVYLKDSSVNVENLSARILDVLPTIRDVLASLSAGPLVITSGNDGTHVPGSYHGKNLAVDFRSLHLATRVQRELVGAAVARAIGAKLKLTGGPSVGNSPGLMLYVEEPPVSVAHFHLEVDT